MDEATVRAAVREFITTELLRDRKTRFTDDEGIISGGLMDSFALAQLAVFAEETFGVYIPDPDLTEEKMDSLDLIVARILRGG
jgi:acyl carrier protein